MDACRSAYRRTSVALPGGRLGPLKQRHDIAKPAERHGTYSFLFWDADDNAWEILSNPKGGYTWIFEQGNLDGRGHFEKGFRHKRPDGG